MSIKRKVISATKWSAVDRLGSQGVQFLISVILARLLLPEQFGLIAMLTIFFSVAQTFLDSGFGAALIQKKDASHIDKCSIFYFNILVGVVAAVAVFFAAPAISVFYSQPILEPLTRFLSINLIINSLSIVQFSILSKELNFKGHAKVSLASTALSGILGVYLAVNGFGVWALAIQQVVYSSVRTVLLWIVSDWRPSMDFSIDSLRQLFGYGSRMLMAGLLDNLFKNIYLVVIGKLFPPALLGFYSRAHSLKDVVSLNLTQIVTKVSFPVFSSIQDDNENLRKVFKKSLVYSAFLIFPAMLGLMAVAEPLVATLLTEKWLPSVFYLQLLCVVGMLLPLQALNLSIIKSKGRSDLYLRLEIVKKTLVVINVLVTWRWGIEAMIIGQIVLSFCSYFLNSYFSKHMIGYSLLRQVRDVVPILVSSIIMSAGVFSLRWLIPSVDYLSLLLTQLFAGVFLYLFLCKVFCLSVVSDAWLIMTRNR